MKPATKPSPVLAVLQPGLSAMDTLSTLSPSSPSHAMEEEEEGKETLEKEEEESAPLDQIPASSLKRKWVCSICEKKNGVPIFFSLAIDMSLLN